MGAEAKQGALIIDHYGGAQYAPLWNWLFVKKGSNISFGDISFPMSFVFGQLQEYNQFTKIGKLMVSIIDISDFNEKVWLSGGHCRVSYNKHIDLFLSLRENEML